MNAELDIKPFLKAIREFHIAEQQPCGVQVVEWVGLILLPKLYTKSRLGVFPEDIFNI